MNSKQAFVLLIAFFMVSSSLSYFLSESKTPMVSQYGESIEINEIPCKIYVDNNKIEIKTLSNLRPSELEDFIEDVFSMVDLTSNYHSNDPTYIDIYSINDELIASLKWRNNRNLWSYTILT